ncbi:MAG TPA: DPP IV N-terminal domain-containing protein [Longimicrobium sp.]|jgi:dipeptidyl aminopeptidase/acylaminoacyl peptidase|uniref:S9 family peptidase n=1 Tax=Longimicrobium sp. TaxID=2029185 RepID=UPI002EDB7325
MRLLSTIRPGAKALLALLLAASTRSWAQQPASSPAPVEPPPPGAGFEARLAYAQAVAAPWRFIQDGGMQRPRTGYAVSPGELGAPEWFRDGARIVRWSTSGPHAGTFVIVDARARTQDPVLPGADLRAQLVSLLGREIELPGPGGGINFALRPDQEGVYFRLGGRPFSLGFADRRVAAADSTDPAVMALRLGRLSPDRRRVAFARGGGWVVSGPEGTIAERAGEKDYEWMLPEQAWSPDSRFLLALRVDQRGVHRIPIVDYRTPVESVTTAPYSKVGMPLARTEAYLVEAATGEVRQLPALEEGYSNAVGWRPDGSEALLLHRSRDGKVLELRAFSPATGAMRTVLREENRATFVADLNFDDAGWRSQLTPLPDGFLWASERDGWRNLYLYGWDGRLVRQVTRGRLVVHEVPRATPREVFFVASEDGDSPYDRHLYRAPLAGGAARRLTEAPGVHGASVSPTGAWFADVHSSRERAPASELAAAGGERRFTYLQADAGALLRTGYRPPEGFTALADDGATRIHGVVFKPYDFDPSRRYPVINFIYGGPFLAVVPWGYAGCFCTPGSGMDDEANAMAQLGYVVVMVDARGTPGRGKAFHDATYGRIGATEIRDQAAAIRQAAATRPWMDLGRVGIYGASWGGYYALRAMLTAPEFYRAGYAFAPGSPWEEAVINEPNLGLPGADSTVYARAENEPLAANLRGALRIAHGTSDVSAPLSATMRMADALIRANRHFEMLMLPGQGHNLERSYAEYLLEDTMRFFEAHLR